MSPKRTSVVYDFFVFIIGLSSLGRSIGWNRYRYARFKSTVVVKLYLDNISAYAAFKTKSYVKTNLGTVGSS